MLLAALAETSASVALTSKRGEKRDLLAACLLAAEPAERGSADALYLSGSRAPDTTGHRLRWNCRRCARCRPQRRQV